MGINRLNIPPVPQTRLIDDKGMPTAEFRRWLELVSGNRNTSSTDDIITSTGGDGVPVIQAPVRIGTPQGYTYFNVRGEQSFEGDGIVWNDLPPIQFIVRNPSAAAVPTRTVLITPSGGDAIYAYTFAYTGGTGDYVEGSYEILHETKNGSVLDIHLHGATQGTDNAVRYAKYRCSYTIANLNFALNNEPSTEQQFTATSSGVLEAELTIPANTPAGTHFYLDLGMINLDWVKFGAMFVYTFKRIAASSTAPTNDPYCFNLGVHVQQDKDGSADELM